MKKGGSSRSKSDNKDKNKAVPRDEDNVQPSAERDRRNKNDYRRTIHKGVFQIPQKVTTKAGNQHPQDTTPEVKKDEQGHPIFRRRCQKCETTA